MKRSARNGALSTSAAENIRPASQVAGLTRKRLALRLEYSFKQALFLALDDRCFASIGRLAERLVLLEALLLGDRIDHGAVGLGRTPEDEIVEEARRFFLVDRGLFIDQLADVGVDAGQAGALQERGLAGGFRCGLLAFADRGNLVRRERAGAVISGHDS